MSRQPAALAAAACALAGCASVSGGPAAYALDPTHTSVAFVVDGFGLSTPRGRFERAQGSVQLDRAAGTGRAEITIATASVSTGVPALDDGLRGPHGLDSEAFPAATFVGERFTFRGDRVIEVAGALTLRGRTLPLTLKATHFDCYPSPLLVRQVCGGDFEATLQRSRWGIDFGLVHGVPDEIRLLVQVEAVRQ